MYRLIKTHRPKRIHAIRTKGNKRKYRLLKTRRGGAGKAKQLKRKRLHHQRRVTRHVHHAKRRTNRAKRHNAARHKRHSAARHGHAKHKHKKHLVSSHHRKSPIHHKSGKHHHKGKKRQPKHPTLPTYTPTPFIY